ncbi:MAG TPA: Spy/CpxP family protein refolding chaperone [Mariniphaga sp.]|nr:Spy/CpxP family protein refolding chaperone [Mariniphaga sp.]
MKTRSIFWTFMALMLISIGGFAQGRRMMPRWTNATDSTPVTCINVLTDLTEDQKAKITEMEATHQSGMAELRLKQRSTFDLTEKNKVREEMIQKVINHRTEVRNLLTESQQKQYDMLHAQNGFAGRRFYGNRAGGRWQGGYGRRGYGGGW